MAQSDGVSATSSTGRIDRGFVAHFLVRFAVVLAVCLSVSPGIAHAFTTAFCGVAKAASSLWESSLLTIDFTAARTPGANPWGVLIAAEDRASGAALRAALDLKRVANIPLSVFFALAVAFPGRHLRRRLAVLALGLAVLQAFPVLAVLSLFSQPGPFDLIRLGDMGRSVVLILNRAIVLPPGMAVAVPALVWVGAMWAVDRQGLRSVFRQEVPRWVRSVVS